MAGHEEAEACDKDADDHHDVAEGATEPQIQASGEVDRESMLPKWLAESKARTKSLRTQQQKTDSRLSSLHKDVRDFSATVNESLEESAKGASVRLSMLQQRARQAEQKAHRWQVREIRGLTLNSLTQDCLDHVLSYMCPREAAILSGLSRSLMNGVSRSSAYWHRQFAAWRLWYFERATRPPSGAPEERVHVLLQSELIEKAFYALQKCIVEQRAQKKLTKPGESGPERGRMPMFRNGETTREILAALEGLLLISTQSCITPAFNVVVEFRVINVLVRLLETDDAGGAIHETACMIIANLLVPLTDCDITHGGHRRSQTRRTCTVGMLLTSSMHTHLRNAGGRDVLLKFLTSPSARVMLASSDASSDALPEGDPSGSRGATTSAPSATPTTMEKDLKARCQGVCQKHAARALVNSYTYGLSIETIDLQTPPEAMYSLDPQHDEPVDNPCVRMHPREVLMIMDKNRSRHTTGLVRHLLPSLNPKRYNEGKEGKEGKEGNQDCKELSNCSGKGRQDRHETHDERARPIDLWEGERDEVSVNSEDNGTDRKSHWISHLPRHRRVGRFRQWSDVSFYKKGGVKCMGQVTMTIDEETGYLVGEGLDNVGQYRIEGAVDVAFSAATWHLSKWYLTDTGEAPPRATRPAVSSVGYWSDGAADGSGQGLYGVWEPTPTGGGRPSFELGNGGVFYYSPVLS